MSLDPFGVRLRAAMDAHGPLCVGIDPHAAPLQAWGLPVETSRKALRSASVIEKNSAR